MTNAFIVSSSQENTALFSRLLKGCGFGHISAFPSAGHFRREAQFFKTELVIIDAPLSDEFGCDLAELISDAMDCSVLFISRSFITQNLISSHLCSDIHFLSRPFTDDAFRRAVLSISESHARLIGTGKENSLLLAKTDEMRLINRAKRTLMNRLGFTELQAHKYIEKQAMNNRMTRKSVALKIIEAYEK